jgi:hypothetical protein
LAAIRTNGCYGPGKRPRSRERHDSDLEADLRCRDSGASEVIDAPFGAI